MWALYSVARECGSLLVSPSLGHALSQQSSFSFIFELNLPNFSLLLLPSRKKMGAKGFSEKGESPFLARWDPVQVFCFWARLWNPPARHPIFFFGLRDLLRVPSSRAYIQFWNDIIFLCSFSESSLSDNIQRKCLLELGVG